MVMKKLILLFLLAGISYTARTQEPNYSLPAEFRDVAIRAFQNANPALKQWFADAASQHPEGRFDSAWTMTKLKDRFGVQNLSSCASLFMVMMEYQRMVNKEARENRNISTADRQQRLTEKEEKLKNNNKQIDRQMEEASQKADQQMAAAQTAFWIGVVSGAAAATTGMISNKEKADSSKLRLNNNRQIKPSGGTKETGNTGEQGKDVNDAISKLQAQISEIKKVAVLK